MIQLTNWPHNVVIPHKLLAYSGGELSPSINPADLDHCDMVEITARLYGTDDVMVIMHLVDAIRQVKRNMKISLTMPYLPYARQDRVCNPGESFGLKVFANLINSLKFDQVTVWDAHSDVAPAVLDNCVNRHCKEFVRKIPNAQYMVFVAPDAGAAKKVGLCAKITGTGYVTASKVRDPKTGEITRTQIDAGELVRDVLIVDDICDGGRTFIELAKVINQKHSAKLSLYVTHLIASQGLDVLAEHFDAVYTPNPWPNIDRNHPILTVIK